MVMDALAKIREWLDEPSTGISDRYMTAEQQAEAARIRQELADLEERRKHYGESVRSPWYVRKLAYLNDELDYVLERGHYER
ncbi:hypothetical protein PWG71_25475 [Nocardiopsis sp. N85]|uniref:hypothetical protein n=1 Tax=Nocardiopsis sp. N85 TaxID=3029400 RepID=UPI00237EF15E|nr:hypothetical protein [Nocardiopsis sp. N85]MDE3724751.1 hypothetical protein [Nocardiopsis sp. N85]